MALRRISRRASSGTGKPTFRSSWRRPGGISEHLDAALQA